MAYTLIASEKNHKIEQNKKSRKSCIDDEQYVSSALLKL